MQFFVAGVACFLGIVLSIQRSASTNVGGSMIYEERQFDTRPVFYYGFINNDHYEHFLPGRRGTRNQIGNNIMLECPPGSVVRATRASFGNPVQTGGGKWQHGRCSFSNSLLVVQRECQGKETCQFKAYTELFLDHGVTDPCPDLKMRILAVDYDCVPLSRPAPLFDAKKETFRSGVTPHYLLVTDHTTSCSQKSSIEVSATEAAEVYNLNDARRVCNLHHQCSHFIWDFKSRQAAFCSGDGWKQTEKSRGFTLGVKPSEFRIPGYAVYLNYAGICTEPNILDKKANVSHMKDGAILCSARKQCDFWTASISPGMVSLPGYSHHLWLCKGPPTMIPRDGFVFAAKAQDGSGVQPETLLEELARPSDIDLYHFPQGYPTASEADRAKSLKQAEDSRLAGQIY